MGQTILKLKNLTKYYPGVAALKQVNLEIYKGEIHALVGENGAGKSTLIKMIAGASAPSMGKICVSEKEYGSFTPAQAQEQGISVIYQEFNLVNELTVYENIYMGRFLKKGFRLDREAMRRETVDLFRQLDIQIPPDTLVKNLTVGYQQMVEIAKAISKKVNILIMDEPSAPLTNAEVEAMFRIVRKLKRQGVTILYISHRMEEIFELCDRVSVMRDGQLLRTMEVENTNEEELIRLMIGRELVNTYPEKRGTPEAETAMELRNVSGNGVKGISLSLHRGEILGLGGLVGAGRTELAELIFGMAPLETGEILLNGKPVSIKSPRDAIAQKISLIPEDRKRYGAILALSVKDNIVLTMLKAISRNTVIRRKKERELAERCVKTLNIKTPSIRQNVNHLSGGNQQKVVFAKWIATDADILILDEPTRGIDVGAKYEIYQIMNDLAARGKSIIMISSDMPELIGMSDRIVVLAEGKLRGELKKEEFSQERIMRCASI